MNIIEALVSFFVILIKIVIEFTLAYAFITVAILLLIGIIVWYAIHRSS